MSGMNDTYIDGVLRSRGNDATRVFTTYNAQGQQTATRPYTTAENAAADAQAVEEATLSDLLARIKRLEAAVFPAPPVPTDPTTAPTWPASGIWDNGGLLKDTTGKVYRNTSGGPLTVPPSGMPGGGAAWAGSLYIVEYAPPATGAWATGVAYKVGDQVTYQGSTYRCISAHTSQAAWTPTAVPALWTKL